MKKALYFLAIIIFTSSCSTGKLISLLAKKPDIEFKKPLNFRSLTKYEKDAIFLIELVRQAYPRLYSKIPEATYENESVKFIANTAKVKTNNDFEIEVQKFMALLKDGHSSVLINPYASKEQFGVLLFKEKENWVIRNIDKVVDSSAIGSKLISVNGLSVDKLNEKIERINSGENSYFRLYPFGYQCRSPKFWKAIGAYNNKNLQLVTEKKGKQYTFEIAASEKPEMYTVKPMENKYPITDKKNDGFYYQVEQKNDFAYLQMNTCLDLVAYKDGIGNHTNFITYPLAMIWIRTQTKNAKNFGLTLRSLLKEVNEKKINNLIIDLRYNGGGDAILGKQLLWYLTEQDTLSGFTEFLNITDYSKRMVKKDYKWYNTLYQEKYDTSIPDGEVNLSKTIFDGSYFSNLTKEDSPYLLDKSIPKFKGNVYVLIGTNTFSAAQILATTFADNNIGTLVGRPSGNKPTTQTGASLFKLPNTKTLAMISYTYMERPNRMKNKEDALYPDVETYSTFETWLEGNDVSFDFIMNEIAKKE